MLGADALAWTAAIGSVLAGLGALLAAIAAIRTHGQVRTGNGNSIGQTVSTVGKAVTEVQDAIRSDRPEPPPGISPVGSPGGH